MSEDSQVEILEDVDLAEFSGLKELLDQGDPKKWNRSATTEEIRDYEMANELAGETGKSVLGEIKSWRVKICEKWHHKPGGNFFRCHTRSGNMVCGHPEFAYRLEPDRIIWLLQKLGLLNPTDADELELEYIELRKLLTNSPPIGLDRVASLAYRGDGEIMPVLVQLGFDDRNIGPNNQNISCVVRRREVEIGERMWPIRCRLLDVLENALIA
ncbi:MAG: hypothetical protein KBA40_03340 [Candidatus Peribacteraceae bacterium]|nr:hypothetical protein [Candidatus Peribacteraceae bacterium]